MFILQKVAAQILNGVISQVITSSVQKSEDWDHLISSASKANHPNPNFNSQDFTDPGTLSSEQELDFEQLPKSGGISLVPYAFKYDLFNESDTATTSDAGQGTSQDDESDLERSKPKKRKISSAAFSRNSYVKRKRKKVKSESVGSVESKTESSESVESKNESFEESNPQDLGKGKRKRFQNVRMLPIDDAIKCSSPSRSNK